MNEVDNIFLPGIYLGHPQGIVQLILIFYCSLENQLISYLGYLYPIQAHRLLDELGCSRIRIADRDNKILPHTVGTPHGKTGGA